MTSVKTDPLPESYKLTLTTRHLHLHRQVSENNLPKAVTW